MKNIILIIAFLFIKNTEATEIKKNIQVSATIVYNCQVIDEKTFKYTSINKKYFENRI